MPCVLNFLYSLTQFTFNLSRSMEIQVQMIVFLLWPVDYPGQIVFLLLIAMRLFNFKRVWMLYVIF